jgi:hypothetical protein
MFGKRGRCNMFHPNEKEILVREHLRHQKNNANSSTEIKPSGEPRIASPETQEASLTNNNVTKLEKVDGGGVFFN